MYIAILGRQPALSVAELECYFGADAVRWHGTTAALINTPTVDIDRLGGSQKIGRVIFEARGNWLAVSRKIVQHYSARWRQSQHKVTLGISAYGFDISPRDVQKTGIILKQALRRQQVSLRLIPNAAPALNTATSHHNKLGRRDHHIELLVIRGAHGRTIIAESTGVQNIDALAARDQARPCTDAFVGMLPPKLARMMVNLTGQPTIPQANHDTTSTHTNRPLLLDPFCGTGTVLQEALLSGYAIIGSDFSDKMVDYTRRNLDWLQHTFPTTGTVTAIDQADATTHQWPQAAHISAIVCETYLGQPFSAPPSPTKLTEVRNTCNHIISEFLINLRRQISTDTTLVIAVPAWRDAEGIFTHLPLINRLDRLGYQRRSLHLVHDDQLIYYRDNQVVARQLLVLQPRDKTQ